jgi:hypothetical protein
MTPTVKWWHGWAPLVLLPGAVLLFAPFLLAAMGGHVDARLHDLLRM